MLTLVSILGHGIPALINYSKTLILGHEFTEARYAFYSKTSKVVGSIFSTKFPEIDFSNAILTPCRTILIPSNRNSWNI
jgi:hypothetical protein